MTKISIFKEKHEIDLPTLIDSRALICANSGGGKSYGIRKILEETHGKVMSIVLDVEGEFKTLRERYDFLLIGENGDVPLNQRAVHLLPKKLLELNVSTIIDLSDLKKHERIMYVKRFLEALMECPRELWKPCLIIIDETHSYCGQQEKQESTFAVIDLATRGRKRGYCLVACTQRIAKLHKDCVAELNNYMVGRTGLDIDQKRAGEILGFTNKQDILALRDLDAGEFNVFGPAISKKIIKVKVAEVQTTHPKIGMDLKSKIVPPTEKIKHLLSKLSDLPKEAEEEIKTTDDMKKKIRELTSKLRVVEYGKEKQVDEKAVERARERGVREAEMHFRKEYGKLQHIIREMERRLRQISSLATALPEVPNRNIEIPKAAPVMARRIPERPRQIPEIRNDAEETNLGLCERKIYSLLAQYPERSFSKPQVGVFTGYSHNSGGFNNSISRLRAMDLIEGAGDSFRVKAINSELMQEFDFSKTAIISKLNKCEREIYTVLLENPEEEFTKEQIAEQTATSYSSNSGGFNNSISRLNTLGVIKRNAGMIRLNPELLEI